MRLLIKIDDTGDLNYLIKKGSECDEKILVKTYEQIRIEYQDLTGDNSYKTFIDRHDLTIIETQYLTVIDTIVVCLRTMNTDTGFLYTEGAQLLIDEYNIKYNGKKVEIEHQKQNEKTIKILEQLSKSIITRQKIRKSKDVEEQELLQKGRQKTTWEDLVTYIHISLGVQMDYNCSVKQYVSYEKSAKQIIKQRNAR